MALSKLILLNRVHPSFQLTVDTFLVFFKKMPLYSCYCAFELHVHMYCAFEKAHIHPVKVYVKPDSVLVKTATATEIKHN